MCTGQMIFRSWKNYRVRQDRSMLNLMERRGLERNSGTSSGPPDRGLDRDVLVPDQTY